MSYPLGKDDVKSYVDKGEIFAKEEGKDALFTLENNMYNLKIKDHENDDIEIYEEDILGNDVIDLDSKVTEAREINFNRVCDICEGAFNKLISTKDDLILSFDSDEIKIRNKAFGPEFSKLKGIKGLNGKEIDLTLYKDSFENESLLKEGILELENINVRLSGEGWTKDIIKNLIEIKSGSGKIRNGSKFEMIEEEKFSEKELPDSILDKLSKGLIDKITLKAETDAIKAKKAAVKADKAASMTSEAKEDKGLTWNKVPKEVQEIVAKEILKQFKAAGVFVRIELDAEKVNLTDDNKIEVAEGSIKKVSFIGDTLQVTKSIFEKEYKDNEGKNIKLRNNKENKDRARNVAKDEIKKHYINKVLEGDKEYLEGPEGINCKFIIDTEADKFKGKGINFGEFIFSSNKLDPAEVQKLLDEIRKSEEVEENGEKYRVVKDEIYKKYLDYLKLIAKYYKKKGDKESIELYKECVKSYKNLSKY